MATVATESHVTFWDPKRLFAFHATEMGVKLSRTISRASHTFKCYIDLSQFELLRPKAAKSLSKNHIYNSSAIHVCRESDTNTHALCVPKPRSSGEFLKLFLLFQKSAFSAAFFKCCVKMSISKRNYTRRIQQVEQSERFFLMCVLLRKRSLTFVVDVHGEKKNIFLGMKPSTCSSVPGVLLWAACSLAAKLDFLCLQPTTTGYR